MKRLTLICLLILLVFSVVIFPSSATTETRYFRSDQDTVNGLTSYKLGTSQSATLKDFYIEDYLPHYWGIRIWKRSSHGVETEITVGTPVAQVSRIAYGIGVQSNTWSCPEISLASTDSIVIKVYEKGLYFDWHFNGEDGLLAVFSTERLGALQLDSATWTVYYYTQSASGMSTEYQHFRFGTALYNSRIENFQWTPTPSETILNLFGSIGQTFELDHERESSFSVSGSITQTFSISRKMSWSFKLNPSIGQLLGIDSTVLASSPPILPPAEDFPSAGHFQRPTYAPWQTVVGQVVTVLAVVVIIVYARIEYMGQKTEKVKKRIHTVIKKKIGRAKKWAHIEN